MRKTDKKIEKQLIATLTQVCELAQSQFPGFQWITHSVDFQRLPQSLKISCVFDTNDNLFLLKSSNEKAKLNSLIEGKLIEAGIISHKLKQAIRYDTEEECQRQHDGNWDLRLS